MIPISNAKTMDGIKIRKQNRNANNVKNPRKIIAVDTETENGNIFLIADSTGRLLDLEDIIFEKIADWLLYHEGSWIFCWNLSYDAECILKLLPESILKSYKWKHELEFTYKKFVIHYIDKKKLTIRKGKHTVHLYDIMQYYEEKSLVKAYSKNIKKRLDSKYLKTKNTRSYFTSYYYRRHKKEIRNYCIMDCVLTARLAEHWIGTFHAVFGIYLDNWISSGYLAEKVLINNFVDIPRFNESPYAIQELARNSFYGGRFELIKKGFIGECYLYDINSAYPYSLTKIPDIRNGKWVSGKKINPKAKIGFFFVQAKVSDKVKISPFPFIKKNRTICYPSGKFKTFVTLAELLAVGNDPEIKYSIIESYQFIPNSTCTYPFKKFIESQYDRRHLMKEEHNPLEHAIKVILNSIYGKTAQKTGKRIGNMFNPIISATITGISRAQLYSFVKSNNLENDVVAFATDSIACQKKIPNLDSKKLGEMKLDKSANDVIFLSNGFYRFNKKWKNRGIGYDNERKIEIEHLGTRVDKDGNLYISVKSTKTTHIKSGILFNRLKEVGKIIPYEKKIGLNSDKKRYWLDDLVSLNDGKMCDSMPIPIDLVGEIISKNDIDWYGDEKYEPESDL